MNSFESKRSGFWVCNLELRHLRRTFTAFRTVLGFNLLGLMREEELLLKKREEEVEIGGESFCRKSKQREEEEERERDGSGGKTKKKNIYLIKIFFRQVSPG